METMTAPRRNADGTRAGFGSLARGGLRWDSVPMRLFAQSNARFWDPAAIDFSQDRRDWRRLSDWQRRTALTLCAQFTGGEEAVAEDIQPFVGAMAAEGRLEDALYLTQFAFEEARHCIGFRHWLDAVGETGDLHELIEGDPGYRAVFFEALPRDLAALRSDPSPAVQVRASVTYNHVVEGTLAQTGYYTWDQICRRHDILPGMRRLVEHIGTDERRHVAWGTYTCRRHVAADDALWQVFQARLAELMEPVLAGMRYRRPGEEHNETAFGVAEEDLAAYAAGRAARRLAAVERARGRSVTEVESDLSPLALEEAFASEEEH